MADIANIQTDDTGRILFSPKFFAGRHESDHLEFRAYHSVAGASPDAWTDRDYTRVMRLRSDGTVHFYGELIFHDGAVRSFNTITLQVLDEEQVVTSFRSGTVGSDSLEVLRVDADGALYSSSLQFKVQNPATVASALWGTMSIVTGGKVLNIDSSDFILQRAGTDWGKFSIVDASNKLLQIKESGTTYRGLVLDASTFLFKSSNTSIAELTSTGFYAQSGKFIGIDIGTSAPSGGAVGAMYVQNDSGTYRLFVKVSAAPSWLSTTLS